MRPCGRADQGDPSDAVGTQILILFYFFETGNICHYLKVCVATALKMNGFLHLPSNPEPHNLTLDRF